LHRLVTIDNNASTEVSFTGGKFVGTYDYKQYNTENKSILFLGSNNTLYWPQPADTDHPVAIGAFRAYFDLGSNTAGVRAFVLNFGDGEAQGIATTNYTNGADSSEAWYSLDGRKLDGRPTKSGLYIYGGRKLHVK